MKAELDALPLHPDFTYAHLESLAAQIRLSNKQSAVRPAIVSVEQKLGVERRLEEGPPEICVCTCKYQSGHLGKACVSALNPKNNATCDWVIRYYMGYLVINLILWILNLVFYFRRRNRTLCCPWRGTIDEMIVAGNGFWQKVGFTRSFISVAVFWLVG